MALGVWRPIARQLNRKVGLPCCVFRGCLLATRRAAPGSLAAVERNELESPQGATSPVGPLCRRTSRRADRSVDFAFSKRLGCMKRIAILGSTGSIGTSCLDVARRHADRLAVFALAAHRRVELLAQQCHEFRPTFAVIADEASCDDAARALFPRDTTLLSGAAGLEHVAANASVDTVVCGIVGAAGLRSAWAAVEAGKRVALANKETLVVAGHLVMDLARRTGAEILPVDSEHSALRQCLAAGRLQEVERLVLTASGGPFRGRGRDELREVTVEQALAHPTWTMGRKITIDSATMMNKALEIIEARWLFELPAEKISVMVHPQSIIHSLVEFVDGSVISQLSPPDMRLPIQYALSYPDRWSASSHRMSWQEASRLELVPPDRDAFPALDLGDEVARRGGTSGAVLNAANEVAVERFLNQQLKFLDISRLCAAVLAAHPYASEPGLPELLELDGWARKEAMRWTA